MFDLYLCCDLYGNFLNDKFRQRFCEKPYYNNIKKNEYFNDKKNNSYLTFLEREETEENIYFENDTSVIIYGSLFTNNKYREVYGLKPSKLNAKDMFEFIQKQNDYYEYLKGSYVLLIIESKSVKIVTDKLNVLPLYYAYKNGVFIISSNVRMILDTGMISNEIDDLAVTEQLLFDYMLEDRYFLKNIKKTENGRIYEISDKGIKENVYWNIEKLYCDNLINKRDSLELLSNQLKENVNLYVSDSEKVLISLTGGFDGRTNLAMLDKNKEDYLCYSYGKPGSKQIEIPQLIAKELNFDYQPIYLDEDFEKEYSECVKKVIESSNGTAPINRANYPYAYSRLNGFSNTILTGLFGSEILRPLHRGSGIFTNDLVEELLLSENPFEKRKFLLDKLNELGYLNNMIIENNIDVILNKIKAYNEKYFCLGKLYPYFFFYLQEGIRKYFMQEIQIERMYVTTRFPYFDSDLVELIHKTPFAGMYNGFLGKSKAKRRKGQLLYAHIVKKFKPELGNIILDRGYKPNDLLKRFPFNYLIIAKGVYNAKKYIKQKGNDTFDTSGKWEYDFLSNFFSKQNDNEIFNNLAKQFHNKKYLKDQLKYYHFISFTKYIIN